MILAIRILLVACAMPFGLCAFGSILMTIIIPLSPWCREPRFGKEWRAFASAALWTTPWFFVLIWLASLN